MKKYVVISTLLLLPCIIEASNRQLEAGRKRSGKQKFHDAQTASPAKPKLEALQQELAAQVQRTLELEKLMRTQAEELRQLETLRADLTAAQTARDEATNELSTAGKAHATAIEELQSALAQKEADIATLRKGDATEEDLILQAMNFKPTITEWDNETARQGWWASDARTFIRGFTGTTREKIYGRAL